ncbi:MAG TPA: serine hydrolase [Novosphingobium sp.]|nr:serine hydrolase [Novosphingobium sp.]
MVPRLPFGFRLIAPLALLPALIGCHGAQPAQGPLSAEALGAVVAHPGPSRQALARAVDALFTEKGLGETRALLVVSKGQLVAERYAPGFGKDTRFIGWSMSKTVTGLLIGMLVSDGQLRLDMGAPIPAWQRPGDPRGEITLRQLLQMRSGLAHVENSDPPQLADTARMLFLDGRDNMAAYAESQPLVAEPGKRWVYSTATSVILADIATRALTDSADAALRRRVLDEYFHTRLTQPLGLKSMVAEYDAAGTMLGGSMIYATARDWGRLGEFLRQGGRASGTQVVPVDWIRFMTEPSPANPGYGGQLWINRPQSTGKEELFPGRAPASLFALIGHLGQYVLVSPDQQLVVVRLGKSTEEERVAVRDRLADIVELFPAR